MSNRKESILEKIFVGVAIIVIAAGILYFFGIKEDGSVIPNGSGGITVPIPNKTSSLSGVWLVSANERGAYGSGGPWETKWEMKEMNKGLSIEEINDDIVYGKRRATVQVNHFARSGKTIEMATYEDWNFAKVSRAYKLEMVNPDLIEGTYTDKTASPFGGGLLDGEAKGKIRFFRDK